MEIGYRENGKRVVWVQHPDRLSVAYYIPDGLTSIERHITDLRKKGDDDGVNQLLEAWKAVKAEVGTNA